MQHNRWPEMFMLAMHSTQSLLWRLYSELASAVTLISWNERVACDGSVAMF